MLVLWSLLILLLWNALYLLSGSRDFYWDTSEKCVLLLCLFNLESLKCISIIAERSSSRVYTFNNSRHIFSTKGTIICSIEDTAEVISDK